MLLASVWHFMADDPEDRLVAVAVAVGRRARERRAAAAPGPLAAGPRGLVVRELLSTRRIEWSEIRSVSSALRGRLGVRNQVLEIDLLDDSLYVFGRFDLGVPPPEVRRELVRQRGSGAAGLTGRGDQARDRPCRRRPVDQTGNLTDR